MKAILGLAKAEEQKNNAIQAERIQWRALTHEIFAMCDFDQDGFLNFKEGRWLALASRGHGGRPLEEAEWQHICKQLGGREGDKIIEDELWTMYETIMTYTLRTLRTCSTCVRP